MKILDSYIKERSQHSPNPNWQDFKNLGEMISVGVGLAQVAAGLKPLAEPAETENESVGLEVGEADAPDEPDRLGLSPYDPTTGDISTPANSGKVAFEPKKISKSQFKKGKR